MHVSVPARRRIAVFAAGALVTTAVAGLGATAHAATDDTAVTFSLTAGSLAVTAPETKNLGSVAVGAASTVSGQLGQVSVDDDRGGLIQTWAATVASTNFVTGGGDEAGETILATTVLYATGALTNSGVTAVSASQTAGNDLNLALPVSPVPMVAATAGAPSNSSSWNPTLTVPVTAVNPIGTYTGTITHSVS